MLAQQHEHMTLYHQARLLVYCAADRHVSEDEVLPAYEVIGYESFTFHTSLIAAGEIDAVAQLFR